MSNKRFSATEISEFQSEHLQCNRVVRAGIAACTNQAPDKDAVRVERQRMSSLPAERSVCSVHLLVRTDGCRAVCCRCGQSYPLTPSGDLDREQIVREALLRPLFGRGEQCRL